MSERAKILIAEDETLVRLDLREILEGAGFDVVAARDGLEAVSLAREHAPDAAVLDVKMPRLDGVTAARAILEERSIPIVMLTAYGYGELVARAIDAGVYAYLVKPFREDDLLSAVRGGLEASGAAEQPLAVDLRSEGGRTWSLALLRGPDGRLDVSLREPPADG